MRAVCSCGWRNASVLCLQALSRARNAPATRRRRRPLSLARPTVPLYTPTHLSSLCWPLLPLLLPYPFTPSIHDHPLLNAYIFPSIHPSLYLRRCSYVLALPACLLLAAAGSGWWCALHMILSHCYWPGRERIPVRPGEYTSPFLSPHKWEV